MWYSESKGLVKTPRAITVNDVQHPANVFRVWSKDELAAIGFRPARVEIPDSRYYDTGAESHNLVDGEWVISYASTEKNVEDLKSDLIAKIKKNVGNALSGSDWRVIREADGGTVMTDVWKTYRNEVRAHGNSLESGVESFASLQAIKNFQNHDIIEVRYVDVDGSPGTDTEDINRTVDKTYWGWPTAPDAVVDPYHKEYK